MSPVPLPRDDHNDKPVLKENIPAIVIHTTNKEMGKKKIKVLLGSLYERSTMMLYTHVKNNISTIP